MLGYVSRSLGSSTAPVVAERSAPPRSFLPHALAWRPYRTPVFIAEKAVMI